jgi:hypothetical protein
MKPNEETMLHTKCRIAGEMNHRRGDISIYVYN